MSIPFTPQDNYCVLIFFLTLPILKLQNMKLDKNYLKKKKLSKPIFKGNFLPLSIHKTHIICQKQSISINTHECIRTQQKLSISIPHKIIPETPVFVDCCDSYGVVQGPLAKILMCSQGQSHFQDNPKMIFAFSISLVSRCTVFSQRLYDVRYHTD